MGGISERIWGCAKEYASLAVRARAICGLSSLLLTVIPILIIIKYNLIEIKLNIIS